MGKLVIQSNPDPEKQALERALHYASLPFEDKWKRLMSMIHLAVKLNGGKPLKSPQGKGIVIRKPNRPQ